MPVKQAEGTQGFVRRLNQACDDVPHIIPPLGEGRQIAIAKKLGLSQQGVRKWFTGEAMPRRETMQRLARLLEVDEPWLALGIMPEVSREENRITARNIDGAVMLVMGLVTLAGGACATPVETDERRGYVDFYAILRGTQMAVHVSFAKNVSPGVYTIAIPREYREVRTIAVISLGETRFDFIDLDAINTPKYMQRKSGGYALTVSHLDGRYRTGEATWNRITHFEQLA